MPAVTAVWVVMSAYGQVPNGAYDQKGKVVQWLQGLPEIPTLRFFKFQVTMPESPQEFFINDFLPDYVPPGEEPDPEG
jgi:hypothetical protein